MIHSSKILRSLFMISVMSIAAIGMQSCNSAPKAEDPEEVADEQNDDKFDENKKERDAKFLVDAAEINLKEIGLSKLALTKSTAADVKSLAQMMIDAHMKSFADLKGLADKKQVSIPTELTEDGKDAQEKINGETGEKFDKQYCEMMVKGHKDAIDKFEKIIDKTEDADIKSWASATLPALQGHLQAAEACEAKHK